jgi:integrase
VRYLFTEFCERFLRPGRKYPQYAEAVLKRNVLTEWAGRDARTITPREVVELLDQVADRAPVMANRTASLLGQMYRFGIHRQIVADSPVKLLFRPGGKEKPRTRFLSDRELTAYLKKPRACTRFGRLACVINILLLTGQRRGELALARWTDVSFEEKTWTIPDEHSKSGRGHSVPLSEWALKEFRALKSLAGTSAWVLPTKKNSGDPLDPKQLTRGLAKCLKRFKSQGIARFTLHDLRRTCRTGLSVLRVPAHIAERVLNHVQPGIAGVYDRYDYLEEKREALDKWSEHLRACAAPVRSSSSSSGKWVLTGSNRRHSPSKG